MSRASTEPELQLGDKISEGGFGMVHEGRWTTPAGIAYDVAVKILNRVQNNPDAIARMYDEAQLLAALRHRAIVRIVDLVAVDGEPALVMERVDGADLGQLLAGETPLSPRAVCEIVAEVADALEAAHTLNDAVTGQPRPVIHRDIKPANIMLTPKGEVKLLDFGIAWFQSPDRRAQTSHAVLPGSLGYIAPERLRGRDLPASDVYSLGIVLAQGLIGIASVPADVADLARHYEAEPGALCTLLKRMVADDPALRPTAGETGDALRGLAGTLPGLPLRAWAREHIRLRRSRPAVPSAISGPQPVQPISVSSSTPQTVERSTSYVAHAVVVGMVLLVALAAGGAMWAHGRATGSETEPVQTVSALDTTPGDGCDTSLLIAAPFGCGPGLDTADTGAPPPPTPPRPSSSSHSRTKKASISYRIDVLAGELSGRDDPRVEGAIEAITPDLLRCSARDGGEAAIGLSATWDATGALRSATQQGRLVGAIDADCVMREVQEALHALKSTSSTTYNILLKFKPLSEASPKSVRGER